MRDRAPRRSSCFDRSDDSTALPKWEASLIAGPRPVDGMRVPFVQLQVRRDLVAVAAECSTFCPPTGGGLPGGLDSGPGVDLALVICVVAGAQDRAIGTQAQAVG